MSFIFCSRAGDKIFCFLPSGQKKTRVKQAMTQRGTFIPTTSVQIQGNVKVHENKDGIPQGYRRMRHFGENKSGLRAQNPIFRGVRNILKIQHSYSAAKITKILTKHGAISWLYCAQTIQSLRIQALRKSKHLCAEHPKSVTILLAISQRMAKLSKNLETPKFGASFFSACPPLFSYIIRAQGSAGFLFLKKIRGVQ